MYKLIFIFLFISNISYSQTIQGKTMDANTKKRIPYVSIGILHTNIGTVSDTKGEFRLNITKAQPFDTLVISEIGYLPVIIPLPDYFMYKNSNSSNFELEPETELLDECIIDPGKTKQLIAGNRVDNNIVCAGFSSNVLGTEIGTVLKYHKKKPGRIENVNFNVTDNQYDSRPLA